MYCIISNYSITDENQYNVYLKTNFQPPKKNTPYHKTTLSLQLHIKRFHTDAYNEAQQCSTAHNTCIPELEILDFNILGSSNIIDNNDDTDMTNVNNSSTTR